jgi:hypothetical protein
MKCLILFGLTLGAAGLASASPPHPPVSPKQIQDPIERLRIEAIMAKAYAKEIGLNESQRAFVVSQLELAQKAWQDLRGKVESEQARLSTLIGTPDATEAQIADQLDRLLDLERQIKRANLVCAVRVRRQLTAAQVSKLGEMELPPPPPPPAPPLPPPPPPPPPTR